MIIQETPIKNLMIIYPENGPRFPDATTIIYNGREKFLVDIGIRLSRLEKAFSQLKISIEDIDYIILTHLHPDHGKSVWRIKQIKPEIEIYLNEKEAQYSHSWENFFKFYGFHGQKDVIDEWMEIVGKPLDFAPFKVDKEIKPYEKIEIDNLELEFIPTPGHTIGHTAIKIDNLIISSDIDLTNFPWYGHPNSSIEDFLRSIDKLIELNPRYLITMHRGLITENTVDELEKYKQIIFDRDEKIKKALEKGVKPPQVGQPGLIYPKIRTKTIKFFEENMVKKHIERVQLRKSLKN